MYEYESTTNEPRERAGQDVRPVASSARLQIGSPTCTSIAHGERAEIPHTLWVSLHTILSHHLKVVQLP
jgi:hypothetical protein